jgi:Domain of unknown function (DUF4157)
MLRLLAQRASVSLQTKHVGSSDAGQTAAPPIVYQVLASPGQPLDASTREFFEPRFGHDFSRVRVHTDRQAAESVRAVGAVAYTVDSEIAFADGRYRPRTPEGRRLLAHELAHVAEQRGAADAGRNLQIGGPSDPAERDADAAAEHAFKGPGPAPLCTVEATPTLRRVTIDSWAGSFDNDLQYDLKSENNGKGKGAYGATIQIRFTPKGVVQADKVALVQTASSSWNDVNYFIGSAAERRATETRSTASGTHIDQINPSSRTPLAAMKDPPSTSNDLAASIPGRLARFGTPSAADKEGRQAWLMDPAGLGPVPDGVAASQSLETTALAVSGPQKGVYYGAVTWGWEKAAGAKAATLKPFRAVSKDAPSSEFGEAAKLWNVSTTDQKQQRLALPIVTGKFVGRTRTPLMERADGGKRVARLDLNTRVKITGQTDQKHPDWSRVIVTEGSQVGKQGWVKTSLLSDMRRKKSL